MLRTDQNCKIIPRKTTLKNLGIFKKGYKMAKYANIKNHPKRGRPKIQGKIREPNGRITRSKKALQKIAIEKRAKKYGLTLEQAADPRSKTYLGRLSLIGKENGLSREQYQAAILFLKIRDDYKRSIHATEPKNMSNEEKEKYKAWTARARNRYSIVLKAIEEAQLNNSHENLYAALQYVLIEGQELSYLLGTTRLLLNALHKHFFPFLMGNAKAKYYNITLATMSQKKQVELIQKDENNASAKQSQRPI